DALERYDGTVVAVSHDRYFLDRIADRIVHVADGAVRAYEGGWSANGALVAASGSTARGGGKPLRQVPRSTRTDRSAHALLGRDRQADVPRVPGRQPDRRGRGLHLLRRP